MRSASYRPPLERRADIKDIAFVEHGSYFFRCLNCGDDGPATSWICIAPRLQGSMKALYAEPWPDGSLFAEGAPAEIADAVSLAATSGRLIRLIGGDVDA